MTSDSVVEIVRNALWAAFWLSAPLLITGFITGVLISLAQILTSIQDTAFNSVPRLAAFLVALVLFFPWMLSRMMSYCVSILGDLGRFAH